MEIEIDTASRATAEALEPHLVDELGRVPDRDSLTGLDYITAAAEVAGLTVADLIGKDRHRPISRPRQVAIWLIRRDLRWSLPYLGREFGKRDHTTIMAACRRIDELRNREDSDTLRLIARVEARLCRAGPGVTAARPSLTVNDVKSA